MTGHRGGGGCAPLAACLALVLAVPAGAGEAPVLRIERTDGGPIAELPLEADGRWCLHWAHSVTGGAVADCFRVEGGEMVLERSFLHDFAAGLGTLPGRGTLHSAEGGGYWIEGIDAPLPDATLPLRVGRPGVGHRLASGPHHLALSELAPGRRVLIRPDTRAGEGGAPD